MFICPSCNVQLARVKGGRGVFWACPTCNGRSSTISLLRKNVPRHIVNQLWQTAISGDHPHIRRCPSCNAQMSEVPTGIKQNNKHLDVCTVCHFIWFDPSEYESLPLLPRKPTYEETLPQEAREELALIELNAIREKALGEDFSQEPPDDWWQWVAGFFGMPVEHDAGLFRQKPWITWSLTLIVTAVSVMAFTDLENVIDRFGLIPDQLRRYAGLTLLTSFFLHAGVFHLVCNMYFFMVFGDNVEEWLGKGRFLLLILLATIMGDLMHIFGDPASSMPCVGASGGISGVIAFYALKFPNARLGFMIRFGYVFKWIRLPAFWMFLFWLVLQLYGTWAQLSGFSNVSALAHLGGAAVGCAFWLLLKDA